MVIYLQPKASVPFFGFYKRQCCGDTGILVSDKAQLFEATHLHWTCDPPEKFAIDATLGAPLKQEKIIHSYIFALKKTYRKGSKWITLTHQTPRRLLPNWHNIPSPLHINNALSVVPC
jgi:hypothetical protein